MPLPTKLWIDGAALAAEGGEVAPVGEPATLEARNAGKPISDARWELETGALSVNSSRSVFLEAPFGGWKRSGLGRELGMAALEAYTEAKSVYFETEEEA